MWTRGRSLGRNLSRRVILAAGMFPAALPGAAQVPTGNSPDDTYESPAVATLIQAARASRLLQAEGLEGYQARLRHRFYVGVTALRFRRERGIFEQERLARVSWSSDGTQEIVWEGMRAVVPIAGLDTHNPTVDSELVTAEADTGAVALATTGFREDLATELLQEIEIPAFDLDPNQDGHFDGDEFILPLADDAPEHYRYLGGDTLTIDLPVGQEDVVLYEVRVEPRRTDYDLLAASLWFDSKTGSLVRATYKPARPFNLALDDADGAEDGLPTWVARRIELEIEYVTVEYTLQRMQYWLPRRFAAVGEMRFTGFARIPATIEWSLSEHRVNDPTVGSMADSVLPDGWRRRIWPPEDSVVVIVDGDSVTERRITVVPPTDELIRHPELMARDWGEGTPLEFGEAELSVLVGELEQLLPTHDRFRPRLMWGMERSLLRYNRVEGLSAGAAVSFPVGARTDLSVSARIGSADLTPNLSAELTHGDSGARWSLGVYRDLRSMSDVHDPFDLTSSASALIFGADRGEYYRSTGASVGYGSEGRTRWSIGAFAERHGAVERNTDFFLLSTVRDTPFFPVRRADAGDVVGLRGSLGWFHGLDPNDLVATIRLRGEIGEGDLSYQRAQAAASVSHPVPFGLAGALEVAAGHGWGQLPTQRNFFLGGHKSLRGGLTNEFNGSAFWRARGELATGFAIARVALFADLGKVGAPGWDWTFDNPVVSVGVGTSLLDGLLRFDVARGVRSISRWRAHLYMDGLF